MAGKFSSTSFRFFPTFLTPPFCEYFHIAAPEFRTEPTPLERPDFPAWAAVRSDPASPILDLIMASRAKFIWLPLAAAGALALVVWRWQSTQRPADQLAPAQKQHLADVETARWVDLKNTGLARLENEEFAAADSPLLELAAAGTGDPTAARNWAIARILAAGQINEDKDPQTRAEALRRASQASNLEWSLERKGPMSSYVMSRIAHLEHAPDARISDLHRSLVADPGEAVFMQELYQSEGDSSQPAKVRDAQGILKALVERVPDNTYVLLECLDSQARLKEPGIFKTLDALRDRLLPFAADAGKSAAGALRDAITSAAAAARSNDWNAVARRAAEISRTAIALPVVQTDRRRVERGLLWFAPVDFSADFYQQHPVDRSIPSRTTQVSFRKIEFPGPLDDLSDARCARMVDFDADDRLDLAVLRAASFEIHQPPATGRSWTKSAAISLPAGGFERFLAAELDGDDQAARLDFVLLGPAGVAIVEVQPGPGGGKPSLRLVRPAALSERTTGARAAALIDFDNDGLLDLVVLRNLPAGAGTSFSVWRNRGRAAFDDVTPRSGLSAEPRSAADLAIADWDGDGCSDLIFAGKGDSSPLGVGILLGRGAGRFHLEPIMMEHPALHAAQTLALLDADASGSWDLLAGGPAGMALLRTHCAQPGQWTTIGAEAVSDFPPRHMVTLDFDNDGRTDVLAWNMDAVRVFRGVGNGRFEPADALWPADVKTIEWIDAGDVDADGDVDLVVVTADPKGRVLLLRNEGGNANNWIDVALDGRPAAAAGANSLRINRAAIGASLTLRRWAACQLQVVEKPRTLFGLGSLDAADVLRIVWPTGVPTNVIAPAKNRTLRERPPARVLREVPDSIR